MLKATKTQEGLLSIIRLDKSLVVRVGLLNGKRVAVIAEKTDDVAFDEHGKPRESWATIAILTDTKFFSDFGDVFDNPVGDPVK